MTGIEKILKGITDDGEAAAAEILSNAKKQSGEIEKQGKEDAAQFLTLGKKAVDKKTDSAKSNADSAAALKKRNILLNRKSELIDDIIKEAVNCINALPDGEYFARLVCLAKKYATGKQGVLRISAADHKRDTAAFKGELEKLNITLDETPVDINGGFILIYGSIEISAQISALVKEKHEKIVDAVNQILFS